METDARTDIERRFEELSEHWPDRRVEVIDGRIVVRELSTAGHADIVFRLLLQLMPYVIERSWQIWPEVTLFLGPQVDRYRPDVLVVPQDPLLWGDDHVYGTATYLVVEVVSKSSARDDHEVKPRTCARGNVPLYLVIDAFAGKARLLSHPGEAGYAQEVHVNLGEPLRLPEPWDLVIDTGRLTGQNSSDRPSGGIG
ncbi:Uma2 family endonuclease [Actinoallomurus rhizosphaericola]|uniref:Uma2 family endonuclease n=1 Tax=Actinoallomurus rhizosphaericola TaxID=2952536 RepID=UPI00209137CC|nr:Uma2 family endonuclease [Actinoallomurus rhizosphaericola]MCO5992023.1 Uma2 family endonuclease [Actinoallomurus rhizosphaericola]